VSTLKYGPRFSPATILHRVPFQRSTSVVTGESSPWTFRPTARQLVALKQETPRKPESPSAGFSLVGIDQLVPSQCSTSVWPYAPTLRPTATQNVVLGHDTPRRTIELWLPGFGMGEIAQLDPFHRIANVRGRLAPVNVPTAMHIVALAHETPERMAELAPAGFGLGITDQALPFQRSINVFVVVPVEYDPTAKQLVGLAQSTPFSIATMLVESTAGLGCVDHVVPFQRSRSGLVTAPPKKSPTAKHVVVDGHDTASNSLREAPVGGGVIDHAVPFQRSARVTRLDPDRPIGRYEPTVMQLVEVEHDTPLNSGCRELAGFGVEVIDQLVPSKASASVKDSVPSEVSIDRKPMAIQLVALEQETSNNCVMREPAGVGLATIDQLDPFHRSTSVFVPVEEAKVPTAKQSVELTQSTPARYARVDPAGMGAGTIDQLDPFHRCVRILVEPASYVPVAMQLVALVHETLNKPLDVAPAGTGLATTVQVVPFHRSTNVFSVVPLSTEPTAKQLVALTQETLCRAAVVPGGVGLDTIDHAVPFHRSTYVQSACGPAVKPTAKQLVSLTQSTSVNNVSVAPVGFGLGTSDQLVPFQRSINDLLTLAES
jgi:hypothetical protein